MNYSLLSKYRSELMGLAILFIAMFHVWMPQSNFFYPLRRLGNVGVDMFLFVSGIGLWYSWTKLTADGQTDKKSIQKALKTFFSHRYRRIYPVWLLVASVFYIWKYATVPGGAYSPDIPNLVANILFNWSFWRADDLTFWYVPATMMLYLFAPAYMQLTKLCPIYRWLPVAFMIVAAMVRYVPLIHNTVGHLEIFFSRIPIFFIGINMGKYVMEKREMGKGVTPFLLLIFVLSTWLCLRFEYIGHCRFPLFMERMVYIPLTVSALLLECKLLSHCPAIVLRFLTFLGGISLEIYLLHIEFVIRPLGSLHLGYCLTTLCTIIISIPAAYLLRKITTIPFSLHSRKGREQKDGAKR